MPISRFVTWSVFAPILRGALGALLAVGLGIISGVAGPAWSQGGQPADDKKARHLTIELNKLDQNQAACRLSLLIENGLAATISKLQLELVLFDQNKRLMQLVVLDAGRFPKGKSRINQFELSNTPCKAIGRVLLNTIRQCEGDGLTPNACIDLTRTRSLTGVPLAY